MESSVGKDGGGPSREAEKDLGDEETMVLLVRCLICKQEGPSLTPRTHIEKLGMVAQACNASTGGQSQE